MGVIMKLRAKIVAIIIGIALFAFLLGGLIQSGSIFYKRSLENMMVINGTPIKYPQYQKLFDEYERFYKILRNESSLDADLVKQIRNNVWQVLELKTLLNETFKDINLTVTQPEMQDLLFGKNPHPLVKQIFVNEYGIYDKNLEISFYQNRKQSEDASFFWDFLIKQIYQQRLFDKYNALISKSVFSNHLEAEDAIKAAEKTVDLAIAAKLINTVPDSLISVSDEDLKNYYEKKKNIFYQDQETRTIQLVSFKVVPSGKDSVAIKRKMLEIKKEFAATDDNIDFIRLNAETPEYPKYFKKSELSSPLDTIMFSAEKGFVYGPYVEANSYKLAKLIDKAVRPDTVDVQYILISPQNPNVKTWDRAKQLADSLKNVLETDTSVKFSVLALKYSDDPDVKNNFGNYKNLTEGKTFPEFNDFCFSNKVGDIGIVKVNFGYYIIKITDQRSPVEKVEIGFVDLPINPSQHTYDSVYSVAGKFRVACKDTASFRSEAKKAGLFIRTVPNLTQATEAIPGFGDDSRSLIQWAFKNDIGSITEVEQFGDFYVIATLVDITPRGIKPFEKVKNIIKSSVIQEKKVDYLYNQYKDLAGNNIFDLAKKLDTKVNNVNNVSFSAFQIGAFGYEPVILATVWDANDTTKVYGLLKGKRGIYFSKANQINDLDSIPQDKVKQYESSIANSYRSTVANGIIEAYMRNAEIEDYRARFF